MDSKETLRLHNEIRERTVGYIVAALGIVAGLAWNEAIRALIDYVFPVSANSLLAKFLYAIVVTIAIVVLSVYLTKTLLRKKE
jgi:hypothetical protein